MIIVYFAKFKKWVNDKKEFEKQEQLKVPVWIRIVQCAVSMLGFFIIGLILDTAKTMFDEVLLFVICSGISVFIGNIFLIIDSKTRESHKITRT